MAKQKFKMETSDIRQMKAWKKDIDNYFNAFISAASCNDKTSVTTCQDLVVEMNNQYSKLNRYQLKLIEWKRKEVEVSYVK